MKKWTIIIAAFAAIAVIGTTTAATGPNDQGRRLAGPFCVNLSDGAVHAVPKGTKCKPGQTRKLGVAVPCNTVTVKKVRTNPCLPVRGDKGATGVAGPKGETGSSGSQGAVGPVGATGATGAPGVVGAAGPKGADGKDGKDGIGCFAQPVYAVANSEETPWVNPLCVGPKGDTGSAGAKGDKGDTGAAGETGAPGQTGATGEQGVKGDTGAAGAKGDTGATGEAGAKGDTGATGAPGPKGDTGPAGKDGLGDATRWICVHGKPLDDSQSISVNGSSDDESNGGPLFDGGTGEKPDCKGGAKFAFQVVTSGDIWSFEK